MTRSPDLADRPSRLIALASLLVAGLAIGALMACWGGRVAHAQANQPPAGGANNPPPPGGGPGGGTPPPQTPPGGAFEVEIRLPDLGREQAIPELPQRSEIGAIGDRIVMLVPINEGGVVAADYDLQVLGLATLQSLGQDMVLAAPPSGLSPLEAISLVELDPRVVVVQLDLPYALQRGPEQPGELAAAAGPDEIVEQLARAEGVLIGLVDSAVEVGHPALAGAAIELADVVKTPLEASDAAHGTAMAGAILGGDQAGGEARGARMLAIRAFSSGGAGGGAARSATFAVAQAIDLAAVRRVDVLNLSFAGPRDPIVIRLLSRAQQLGVLAIGAAGNAGPEAPPAYPAALPSVLAVTAIDGRDELFKRANRGAYVGLAAPGVDVIVAGPGGGYGISSGTSIAAAKVSGLAAAILGQSAGLAPAALHDLLRQTAIDLGPAGPDEAFGAGKVDGDAARAAAQGLAGLKEG